MNREILVDLIEDVRKDLVRVHNKAHIDHDAYSRTDLLQCLYIAATSLYCIQNYVKDGKIED